MNPHDILFWFFSIAMLLCGLLVIINRNPVTSALFLVLSFCSLAGIYLLLQAEFLGLVQIIVYAGAIMVLFLFVIMLLDPFSAAAVQDKKKYLGIVAVLLGAAGLLMLFPLLATYRPGAGPAARAGGSVGSVASIGATLFNQYTLPFEVTSILILVAIIGTVVLARRQS